MTFETAAGAFQLDITPNHVFNGKARFDFLLQIIIHRIIIAYSSLLNIILVLERLCYNYFMDKQDYLDKISASSKPVAAAKKGFWHSTLFKVIAGAVAGLIVIIVIGSVISGSRPNIRNQASTLKLHLDGTMEMISTYQSDVKSSKLRSSSASLYSVLSNANDVLTNFLVEKYNFKTNSVDKKMLEDAETSKEDLNTELFSAKINGILDRIYAHKMAYEISIIAAEEATIIRGTNDETLKNSLTTSYDSLNNLYSQFNDFSETK